MREFRFSVPSALLTAPPPWCWFAGWWAGSKRCLPVECPRRKLCLCFFQAPGVSIPGMRFTSISWLATLSPWGCVGAAPTPRVHRPAVPVSLGGFLNSLPGHGAALLVPLNASRAPGSKQRCRPRGCHRLGPHVLCADSGPHASGTPGSP